MNKPIGVKCSKINGNKIYFPIANFSFKNVITGSRSSNVVTGNERISENVFQSPYEFFQGS